MVSSIEMSSMATSMVSSMASSMPGFSALSGASSTWAAASSFCGRVSLFIGFTCSYMSDLTFAKNPTCLLSMSAQTMSGSRTSDIYWMLSGIVRLCAPPRMLRPVRQSEGLRKSILSDRQGMSNDVTTFRLTMVCRAADARWERYPTMLSPASTGITAPLIQVMSGSARATRVFATCSGVVRRPRGLRLRASSM